MNGSPVAILLAGSLRPSPLRQQLDVPALCLPTAPEETLLDLWLAALESLGVCERACVVVNDASDERQIARLLEDERRRSRTSLGASVMTEPGAWRGTAGVLRDVSSALGEPKLVIVIEASCLPPVSLAPLLDPIERGADAAVGMTGDHEPAGVSIFRRDAIAIIPAVGYFDLKEQLLPAIHRRGMRTVPVPLGSHTMRLRDRRGYLAAVKRRVNATRSSDADAMVATDAMVSPSARVAAASVIGPRVIVEEGAVIRDSVVLAGAIIGAGAIVSRSVIGPLASVPPRDRVIGEVVSSQPSARRSRRRFASRAQGRVPRTAPKEIGT